MQTDGYETLRVRVGDGIARATIDHPPINLFDLPLILEMDRFGREVESDPDVRAVIIDSADPEFFIAHADVSLILQLPHEEQPAPTALPLFTAMADRFRTMPKVTIAVIEGRARGGGSELVLAMDLRFAALGRAVLSQPEVAVGIIRGEAERSASQSSSVERGPSRSSSAAAISTRRRPNGGATSTARSPRTSCTRSSMLSRVGSRRFRVRRSRTPRRPSLPPSRTRSRACWRRRIGSARRWRWRTPASG